MREYRRDTNNITWAVITHDDGEIYTVLPNDRITAMKEAGSYSDGAHAIMILHFEEFPAPLTSGHTPE